MPTNVETLDLRPLDILVHHLSHSDFVLGLDCLKVNDRDAANKEPEKMLVCTLACPRYSHFLEVTNIIAKHLDTFGPENLIHVVCESRVNEKTGSYSVVPVGFEFKSPVTVPWDLLKFKDENGYKRNFLPASVYDTTDPENATVRRIYFPIIAALISNWHSHLPLSHFRDEKQYSSNPHGEKYMQVSLYHSFSNPPSPKDNNSKATDDSLASWGSKSDLEVEKFYIPNFSFQAVGKQCVLFLLSGVDAPVNKMREATSSSTVTASKLICSFLDLIAPGLIIHKVNNPESALIYDAAVHHFNSELSAEIDNYRRALVRAHGDAWVKKLSVAMSMASGQPARIAALSASLRPYRPSSIHIPHWGSFWHEGTVFPAVESSQLLPNHKMEGIPVKRVETLDDDFQAVVAEMKKHAARFLASFRPNGYIPPGNGYNTAMSPNGYNTGSSFPALSSSCNGTPRRSKFDDTSPSEPLPNSNIPGKADGDPIDLGTSAAPVSSGLSSLHVTSTPPRLTLREILSAKKKRYLSHPVEHLVEGTETPQCSVASPKDTASSNDLHNQDAECEFDNELGSFWLRKTRQPVLSVLLVRRDEPHPDEDTNSDSITPITLSTGIRKGINKFYCAQNLEVSMPTGSLCSERAAIAMALADNPGMRRKDIKAVAVLSLPKTDHPDPRASWHKKQRTGNFYKALYEQDNYDVLSTLESHYYSKDATLALHSREETMAKRRRTDGHGFSDHDHPHPLRKECQPMEYAVSCTSSPSRLIVPSGEPENAGSSAFSGASNTASNVESTASHGTEESPLSATKGSHSSYHCDHLTAKEVISSLETLNPLAPCGACTEWLRKVSEANPDFRVLTFRDISCDSVFVKSI